MTSSSWYRQQPLLYLAALAIVAGAYFRFHGLGLAPFAVDEYYLSQSIAGVLRTGLPSFLCGGLYMRGIVLQYLAAGLQLAGASAEYAPRLICAVCSLLALPAIYLLGRRLLGSVGGLLVVILCALSVWEIEIARFGRMYAPFQVVFVWYLVFFLRYTVDRDERALWPMISLSLLGPLVWEGGIFLALANFLAPFLRSFPLSVRRTDWRYLLGCGLLLALVYLFMTADFRGYRSESWPPGYNTASIAGDMDAVKAMQLPVTALRQHLPWLLVALIPVAATLFAALACWKFRPRSLLVLGLFAVLAAALLHQLLAAAALILLMLLTGVMDWRTLREPRLAPVPLAILVSTLFWIIFALRTVDWQSLPVHGWAGRVALLAYRFLSVPDVIAVVIRPWARAVPHLGTGLLLLIGVAALRLARGPHQENACERVLLILLIVLGLAAGASPAPREETRYVFFLYPIALILAVSTIFWFTSSILPPRRPATALAILVVFAGFALSEDFQPQHLSRIASAHETFREGMRPAMEEHLIIRTDYRAVAAWLQSHRTGGTVIVNGVHGLDHYFPAIDYFYVEESSPNFPDWSCRHGTVERWGNYPLLYTPQALAAKVAPASTAYLVSFSYDQIRTLESLAALHPKVVMGTGDVIVIELRG
jgi:hypothetical protein